MNSRPQVADVTIVFHNLKDLGFRTNLFVPYCKKMYQLKDYLAK